MDGLPWNWTSYGEYLDSVQALQPALNVVGLAGHSVRYEAMGDRSMDGGQASTKELAHISKMVQQSVEEGAGLFNLRFLLPPDGRCTPTWADLRDQGHSGSGNRRWRYRCRFSIR